jgi:hypothetical protein
VSAVQLVLHAVAPHAYAPHEDVGCTQAPAPSQVPGAVAVELVQLAVPHEIEEPGYLQALGSEPLHDDLQSPLPSHAVREPCGAPVTGVQVPFTTSHAAHCAAHAPLQQ